MKKSLGGLDGFISKFCQTFKEKITKTTQILSEDRPGGNTSQLILSGQY